MAMTFDQLSEFLADWYETDANALGMDPDQVPPDLNPVLRDFYVRFGALAADDSPFRHPKSRYGPLSAQDHIVPAAELELSDGFVPFLHENQGVFTAAAKADHANTYVSGDIGADRFGDFTPTDIPLEETLISASLMETVMSVQDRDRLVTPTLTARRRESLRDARILRMRTVYADEPLFHFLADDVIGLGFSNTPEYFATRSQWRLQPPTFQDVEAEGGGGWSSGPAHPTLLERIEKWVTLRIAARKIDR